MSAFFRRVTLAVLLAATVAAPTRAADPLTPEQKQAVEAVIHDYFLKNPGVLVEVLRAAEAEIQQGKAAGARQALAAHSKELFAGTTSPGRRDPPVLTRSGQA